MFILRAVLDWWVMGKGQLRDVVLQLKSKSGRTPMIETLDIKRDIEVLSERLGKTQDYL
jgi:predicted DNA-binding protein with PD1-like motif